MFDLTIHAFNIADRYRLPVVLLSDEVIGHMVERVIIPEADEIPRWPRKRPENPPNGNFLAFKPDSSDLVPPMAYAGEGYNVHFTGLTHDQRGYPAMTADDHQKLVTRLIGKVHQNLEDILSYEEYFLDDASIVVVSFGCTARSARRAVKLARERGIPAGLFRLISVWPFPEEQIRELAERVDSFLVAELNLGQVSREVERIIHRPVRGVFHAGGAMIPPEPIFDLIVEVAEGG
jgi:2-oxoglutarate ferredoxin oxidoreductase subunit alpha